MKITQFDDTYSIDLATGDTFLVTSTGSNAGFGGDVEGTWGDLSVVGLRQRVALSSNLAGILGDVLTIINTSPLTAQFATPSNAGGPSSVGSNVSITAVWNGGGSALVASSSNTMDLEVPFAATVIRATLLADQSSNTVVSVWRDTYGNFPPTIADSITGANPPTLSAAAKSQDSTLSGWSTSVTAGDILRVSIASNSAATRLTMSLVVARGLP